MTAINPATDIPAGIDTLEKLAQWALLGLERVNKNRTYLEAEANSVSSGIAPLVDHSLITAADENVRTIWRVSFPVSEDYLTGGGKFWTYTEELGNTPLPASYLPA